MTHFLSVSAITDAAKVRNAHFKNSAYDYLKNRDREKVYTSEVEDISIKMLETRDDIYYEICEVLNDAEYDSDDPDDVANIIKEVVSYESVKDRFDQNVPEGIEEAINSLQCELLNHTDKDPFEIVCNLREMIKGRNVAIKDFLNLRADNPQIESILDIEEVLVKETNSEVVGVVCGCAAGWWSPKPLEVPIAVGDSSPLEKHHEVINSVLHDQTGSPTGIKLHKV